ncbi:hypothetical protein Tco_0787621 [Tanacetum coccineum]
MSCTSRNRIACSKVSRVKYRNLVYHDSDEEDEDEEEYYKKDSSLDEILDDLFRIGGEKLRSMEHEEVPNRCDEETVGDTDNESGNLPNFPTFPVTNEFASACIQDKEKEEAPMEDVEMNEDQDTNHLKTKDALQLSLAKDPSLVFMEPKDQSTFVQQITPSSISNEVKMEFKIPHRKHFNSRFDECHTDDDVELPVIVDIAR